MTLVQRPIRFLLNGQTIELDSIEPTRSVLEYLREDQLCVGTKEGCAEGDCGACTVVVGELVDDELTLKTVNACIQFVPTLDGKALFTVEYLKGSDQSLHPVQQSMVDCHGSQCGFCTPGFVMSLWNAYTDGEAKGRRPSREELATQISGNLCRCTGYRPILDAGQAMFDLPAVRFDHEAIASQLRELQASTPLTLRWESVNYHAPRTLDELTDLRGQYPDATLLAGCTDIGLWVNKQLRDLGDILYVGDVDELKSIELKSAASNSTESASAESTSAELQDTKRSARTLRIGAMVSLSDAYAAIAEHYPQLDQMWERFASVPIRNAGTLGGNVANGSPIGDSMPWLLALQASVTLTSGEGTRSIPLEALYIDYMQNAIQANEVLEAIDIPLPTDTLAFRTYKLSKRFDVDISAVCAAFAIELNDGFIESATVAYGGMAAIPKRAPLCEQALQGEVWSEATVQNAMQALRNDFTPLDDMRASAGYRMQVATNLLYRFFLETRPDNPMPVEQTSVFANSLEHT